VDEGRFDIVLVRHGETAWSLSGQHTGRTDIPLTAEGRRQAKLIGSRLAMWSFARVLTSPLARAADTCHEAGFGGVCEETDDLREWDYGDYEGRRTADIRRERPGWILWSDGVPNGEKVEEVARRADRVIDEAQAAEGDVCLFGHGHHLRVLAARWLLTDPREGSRFALAPATLSVLGWEREARVITRWNDAAHLEEDMGRGPDPAR
jgi:broad specificity phosphatase PhoE